MELYSAVETAKEKIKSVQELHDAVMRNGYFVPSIKSPVITEEYLMKVLEETYWVPKYGFFSLYPCPTPPTKTLIYAEVKRLAESHGLNLGFKDDKLPNKFWLITALGAINSGHEFFQKGYHPKNAISKKIGEIRTSKFKESFLKDLPISKKKAKKVQLKSLKIAKKDQRLELLKQKRRDIEKQIEKISQSNQKEAQDKGQGMLKPGAPLHPNITVRRGTTPNK